MGEHLCLGVVGLGQRGTFALVPGNRLGCDRKKFILSGAFFSFLSLKQPVFLFQCSWEL